MKQKRGKRHWISYHFVVLTAIISVSVLFCMGLTYIKLSKGDRLIRAIKAGDNRLAVELLKQGSDANSFDQSECSTFSLITFLFLSVFQTPKPPATCPSALMLVYSPELVQDNMQQEPVELVRELLSRGANVNATATTDSWTRSPLIFHVVSEGNSQCVQLFLDHGANPNARNVAGWTPIMLAANARTTKVLIERGADVNARINEGMTALTLATFDPNAKDKIQLLKKAGARE